MGLCSPLCHLLWLLYVFLCWIASFFFPCVKVPRLAGADLRHRLEEDFDGEEEFHQNGMEEDEPGMRRRAMGTLNPRILRSLGGSRRAVQTAKRRERRAYRRAAIEAETRRHQQKREKEEQHLKIQAKKRRVVEAQTVEKRRITRESAFDEWAHLFQVVGKGDTSTEGAADPEPEPTLSDFVRFVKEKRVVELEELAVRFDLLLSTCADRLRDLCEMGRLQGVLDERGLFVCVTSEQLKEIADFIVHKGRVTIPDLREKASEVLSRGL